MVSLPTPLSASRGPWWPCTDGLPEAEEEDREKDMPEEDVLEEDG